MHKKTALVILTLMLMSAYLLPAEGQGEGGSSVKITEVTAGSHGPGRFRAFVAVKPLGRALAGMVDGNNPRPFAREVKVPVPPAAKKRILSLAAAVLRGDPGMEPVIDRNDILDITIVTSGGKYHMYVRDLGGAFARDDLNELDGILKSLAREAGFVWN